MKHTNKQKSQTLYLSQAENWSENIHITGKTEGRGPVFLPRGRLGGFLKAFGMYERKQTDHSAYHFAAVL